MPINPNFTQCTDQELLQLIQKKDEQALEVLYEKYYFPLFKKAFQRIPSNPKVEEIVQDVFVNFWTKAESLDTEGNVKAYLYATLRNKILHELRTERNRALYMERFKKINRSQKENKGLQDLYARELEEHIQGIITTLSPQCRKAFSLSRFENLSYKEIAERMHLSVNTVEKHVGKALKVLRHKLRERQDLTPLTDHLSPKKQ